MYIPYSISLNPSGICYTEKFFGSGSKSYDESKSSSNSKYAAYYRCLRVIKNLVLHFRPKYFYTLTFSNLFYSSDFSRLQKLFSLFVKRMRKKVKDFFYLAIPELGKTTKRFHIHLLTSSVFESSDWLYGFIQKKRVFAGIGAFYYLVKYISKDAEYKILKCRYLSNYRILKCVLSSFRKLDAWAFNPICEAILNSKPQYYDSFYFRVVYLDYEKLAALNDEFTIQFFESYLKCAFDEKST